MSQNFLDARVALVVDDEALIRMVAVDFLADEGYLTLEAGDGREALAALGQYPEIAVLVTDINMPGEPDGLVWPARRDDGGRACKSSSRRVA